MGKITRAMNLESWTKIAFADLRKKQVRDYLTITGNQ